MRRILLGCAVALAVPTASADAHLYMGCKKAPCMKHVIKPYKPFLASVGRCESGTSGYLRHGLRAVSPSGQYRGRYQFGMPDWHRAGGGRWANDPVNASWWAQAYTAVRWLHINGRQSWPNC